MGAPKTKQFSNEQRDFARIGKAIASPARVAIMQYLYHNRYASNKRLKELVGLSDTAVHQHIQILQKTGFVCSEYVDSNYTNFLNPGSYKDLAKIDWVLLAA